MTKDWRILALWIAFLLAGLGLFAWTFASVPFAEIGEVLAVLGGWQLAALLILNVAIIVIFPWRWWLTLRVQGHKLPYLALAQYRLIAFAISYFTPGQHFGGEPAQVLLLKRRHKLSGTTAFASVSMDRVIELLANCTVLAVGIGVVLLAGVGNQLPVWQALGFSLLLLLLPAGYLAAIWFERRPFGWLTHRFKGRIAKGLRKTEDQLGKLARRNPELVAQGLGIAALIWVALIFEIWLSVYFLGITLNPAELALVVVAGRLALFAPTPGALGALEASQVLAMRALGHDPAIGLSLALLIRARDVFFGLSGFALAALARK